MISPAFYTPTWLIFSLPSISSPYLIVFNFDKYVFSFLLRLYRRLYQGGQFYYSANNEKPLKYEWTKKNIKKGALLRECVSIIYCNQFIISECSADISRWRCSVRTYHNVLASKSKFLQKLTCTFVMLDLVQHLFFQVLYYFWDPETILRSWNKFRMT